MANVMKAMRAYMPRIKYPKILTTDVLAKFMAMGKSVNEADVKSMLCQLRDALMYHSSIGQPVKLDGLGIFRPTISLDGSFSMTFRPDIKIKGSQNAPYGFTGEIINKDMIGKTQADIIARWNEEHPDDPIE